MHNTTFDKHLQHTYVCLGRAIKIYKQNEQQNTPKYHSLSSIQLWMFTHLELTALHIVLVKAKGF